MLRPLVAASLALFTLLSGSLQAEVRTLTDQFGRSITANVLELDGDTLKIRRDDGIVFDLPIGNLSIEDQKSLREWAAKQPKKVEPVFEPNPEYLPIGLSRVKLSTNTMFQYEGYKHSHEMWGYSIQVSNKHLRTVDKIRVEYNVFANTYADLGTQRPVIGVKTIDTLRANDITNVRTEGTEVCKRKSIYYGNSGGEMKGIWLRVYIGKKLVHEIASPESIKETETWTQPGKENPETVRGASHYYY